MAKRPSPRTQDTIVAMCEDGRRRSSVFLSSTIPERTTRQVVGREPHFSVSQIGDIHKDTWLGAEQNLGAIGAVYNLTMDPFEKYDMTFNGAVASRLPNPSPGNYAGQDNGWVLALIYPVVMEFNKSIVDYPNIKRSPGGASNDWRPNLQNPGNPVPLLDMKNPPRIKGGGG
jgi:hypothetical protein